MTQPVYKLTYFNLAGRGEPLRLAFKVAGIEFEDNRIAFGDWAALKPTTKFGTLPTLSIDGKEALSDSSAILRYIGRISNSSLYPLDVDSFAAVEEVLSVASDYDNRFSLCLELSLKPELHCYEKDFPKTPEGADYIKKVRTNFYQNLLPNFLRFYTQFLAKSGGAFLTGANPTIADILVYCQLKNLQKGHVDHIPTTCIDSSTEVIAWMGRMASLPAIVAWYADSK